MPKGKHKISKEKAISLTDAMRAKIAAANSPFRDFPEGFSFDVEAVRQLISRPGAAHFVIRFGWDDSPAGKTKGIVPVLCVADSSFKILETGGSNQPVSTDSSAVLRMVAEEPVRDDSAGDYLDEGSRYPPKP